jgi:hypothetical protein
MAGRPDKTGTRMELAVGLCECSGKSRRTVIIKQKIGFAEKSKKIHYLSLDLTIFEQSLPHKTNKLHFAEKRFLRLAK